MQANIIERLFSSFTDLEQAIGNAKKTLESRGNIPEQIVERLSSYDNILEKQRGLATRLCDHISKGNWDEVSRHVNLINGLSALIRDDAKAILQAISQGSNKVEEAEDITIC